MRFARTDIAGVLIIEWEPVSDERGHFARIFCPQDFSDAGIDFAPVQSSISHNVATGTLRGMHYQPAPFGEAKLVRATRGRVFDVAVDLRPESGTYLRWTGAERSAENGRALLIPQGVAHGFLTLEPASEVLYQIDRMFEPGHGRGIRWNDPAVAIDWPILPAVMSARDATYPDFIAER